jgi:hypothetical protein
VVPDGYPAPSYCAKGGRFGPHDQHQPQGQSRLQPVGDYIYLTYFNAGLQVFDVSDPYTPKIAGYYIPDAPPARRGPLPTDLVTQSEDVLVDRRGDAYVTDKNAGVTILRFRWRGFGSRGTSQAVTAAMRSRTDRFSRSRRQSAKPSSAGLSIPSSGPMSTRRP